MKTKKVKYTIEIELPYRADTEKMFNEFVDWLTYRYQWSQTESLGVGGVMDFGYEEVK